MKEMIPKLFCAVLFCCLLIPSLGLRINLNDYQNCEKRALTVAPDFVLSKAYLPKLEAYFKDHAAFRNRLSHINATIKHRIFKSSAKPGSVLIGKAGWLSYSSKSDNEIASFTHTDLWDPEALENKILSWQQRRIGLAAENRQYHVAIWPNKSTIYDEYVPDKLMILQQDTLSKLDQIMDYISKDSSLVQPLDLRAALLKAKDTALVYYKHDSHWNDYGAFIAYQALMKEIGIKPYELSDLEVQLDNAHQGDLIGLMGLCNSDLKEEHLTIKVKQAAQKLKDAKNRSYYENPEASIDQTILVFRDSYFSALIPYMMLHFKKGYFPWTYYEPQLIKELNPSIVISANVERRL